MEQCLITQWKNWDCFTSRRGDKPCWHRLEAVDKLIYVRKMKENGSGKKKRVRRGKKKDLTSENDEVPIGVPIIPKKASSVSLEQFARGKHQRFISISKFFCVSF